MLNIGPINLRGRSIAEDAFNACTETDEKSGQQFATKSFNEISLAPLVGTGFERRDEGSVGPVRQHLSLVALSCGSHLLVSRKVEAL